jgi:S1-C subfamily serine protease
MLRPEDANEPTELNESSRPTFEERPFQEERPSYRPPLEENLYHAGPPPIAQTAWQESPPLTAGKLFVRQPSPSKPFPAVRNSAMTAFTIVMVAIFGVGLVTGVAFTRSPLANLLPILPFGPQPVASNSQSAREAAIAKVKPSVVQVNVTTNRGQQTGSGVIVDNQGDIVTNNHVIYGAQAIEITFNDGTRTEDVQIAGTDYIDDLAVLKIAPQPNMVVATMGDASQLQVGEDVLAIGSPLGNTETVTHGIISALHRSVVEPYGPIIPNTIQTDAAINPGNSGGALADLQGNIIGIPTLEAFDVRNESPANGVSYAIPISQVQRILPQIIQDGVVTHTGRAALGITGQTMTSALQARYDLAVHRGVLIRGIAEDSPADASGLQLGDVIAAIDGKKVDTQPALTDVLATKVPGDKVSLSINRYGQQLTVPINLGELPANP